MLANPELQGVLDALASGRGKLEVDSRRVRRGDIFIATRNETSTFYRGAEDTPEQVRRFDSNPYACTALENGAQLAIVSSPDAAQSVEERRRILLVRDGIEAMQMLFREVLERDNKFVVGITGSTGKSTLTEMVRVALGTETTYKHLSDRPTPISIPLKALNDPFFYRAENVAIEMPMDGMGQITTLTQIAPPDVSVVLNINNSHIVQLGSMQNIVAAKMEIINNLKPEGTAVLNADDPWLRPQINNVIASGKKVLTFGKSANADVHIAGTELEQKGMAIKLQFGEDTATIHSSYLGETIASSLAAAVAVALAKGEKLSVICDRLSAMRPLPSRMSLLDGKKGETILDDTRIATPQSTSEVLRSVLAVKRADQKAYLIQGPILRSYQHGQVSSSTVDLMSKFDKVVLFRDKDWVPTGKLPDNFIFVPTLEELQQWYDENVRGGNLVMFKGSELAKMWDVVRDFVKPEEQEYVYAA